MHKINTVKILKLCQVLRIGTLQKTASDALYSVKFCIQFSLITNGRQKFNHEIMAACDKN